MLGVAGILILLGLLLFSANERSRRLRKVYRNTDTSGQDLPIKESPLAEAITHTVGIAGGIYIAIITTVNFLRLDVPETFTIFGVAVDPMAGVAFFITILQPFVLTVKDKFFR